MITYGFYNALNDDRLYDAVQMSSIFDGVIEDGVYANVMEFFATVPGTGMTVIVKTGRAWFNHTWTLNDSHLPLEVEESDFLQTRIDAVILEVDTRVEKRENSIKIVKGTPSVNPMKPDLTTEASVYWHPLAYITVPPEATAITGENIQIAVGTEDCPFVRCPLETVSIEDLWQQWEGEFNSWFDNLKAQLTDNVVTNLQNQIDEKVNKADKATEADIEAGTANKWVDAASVSKLMPKVGDVVDPNDPDIVAHPSKYLKMDGSEVDASKLPPDLAEKYVNMVPGVKVVNIAPSSSAFSYIKCFSDGATIGDYDYIIYSNTTSPRAISKVNRSTKTITKTITNQSDVMDSAGTYYGTFGQNLVVMKGSNMTGSVYDQNLNLLRSFNSSLDYGFAARFMGQLPNGRIIVIGWYISSYSNPPSDWYTPVVFYTDNMFANITRASFTATGVGQYYMLGAYYQYQQTYANMQTLPFGHPSAALYRISTGRLFLFPDTGMSLNNSMTYVPIYYSDDNGSTWQNMNLYSKLTQDIPSYSTMNSSSMRMSGFGDTVYVYGWYTSQNANGCKWYSFTLNGKTLSLGPTKLSDWTSYESIGLGLLPMSKSGPVVRLPQFTEKRLIGTVNTNTWHALGTNLDLATMTITPIKSFNSALSESPISSTSDGFLYNSLVSVMFVSGYIIDSVLSSSLIVEINGQKGLYSLPSPSSKVGCMFISNHLNYPETQIGTILHPSGISSTGIVPPSGGNQALTYSSRGISSYTGMVEPVKDGFYYIASSNGAVGVLYIDLSKRVLPPTGEYIKIAN